MHDPFPEYKERKAKIDNYYKLKDPKRPFAISFCTKLTTAVFDMLTERNSDKRDFNEKRLALLRVISSKYDNLIDIFSDSGYFVLKFFFGSEAPIYKEIWIRSFDCDYQENWLRRPFRTKFGIEPHLNKNINLISDFIHMQCLQVTPETFIKDPFADNNLYMGGFAQSRAMAARLAYEIDLGNNMIRSAIESTVMENSGNLSRAVILALVQSRSAWSHELLGKLLLAAKLQEGLRQSIVEAMDEGNTDAYIYLLKLIINNKLERYSSVVRAFDVWTGLPVSSEKPATIRYYLDFILSCITSKETDLHLKSDNPMECYLALICKGFFEIEDGIAAANHLLSNPDAVKRTVAYYWLSQIQLPLRQLKVAWPHIDECEPLVIAFMLPNLTPEENNPSDYSKLFNDIEKILDFIPQKKAMYSLPGMPSLQKELSANIVLEKLTRVAAITKSSAHFDKLCDYADRMSADLRYNFSSELVKNIRTEKQRKTILMFAGDKSTWVRNTAIDTLAKLELKTDEYQSLESMLRFKSEALRKNIMLLLIKQTDKAVLESVRRLANSEDENCHLAAEQLVRDMKTNKKFADVISKAESIVGIISKVSNSEGAEASVQTEENGMGLFDPLKLTILPKPEWVPVINLRSALPDFSDLVPKIKELSLLIEANKDFEYEAECWDKSMSTVILGSMNYIQPVYGKEDHSINSYPLANIFKPAIDRLFPGLELDRAVFILSIMFECTTSSYFVNKTESLFGVSGISKGTQSLTGIPYFGSHIRTLLETAHREKKDGKTFEFYYAIAYMIFYSLSEKEMKSIEPRDKRFGWQYYNNNDEYVYRDWYGAGNAVSFWLSGLQVHSQSDEQFRKSFYLEYAYTVALEYKTSIYMPVEHLARAYEINLINRNDVCFYYSKPGMRDLMQASTNKHEHTAELRKKYPSFFNVVDNIIDHIITVETMRGELPSPLSGTASKIFKCYGIEHFADIVCAMDKRNYVRGYNFPSQNSTKGETLSFLLKNIYPKKDDNAEKLKGLLYDKNLKPQQLMDAAMYAPQWLDIVESYFNILGLKRACVYFHAHLNEMFDDEKQSMVSRYSAIAPEDFKAGAFDLAWFKSALEEIGEKNFKMVYDSAKYISGGNLHKRSQLFSDAVTGKLDITDMQARTSEKRNRDCLLAYTLIPIESDSDALERYLFIEKFKKESKQFGAQRQLSENRTCEIGIDNLARNAGYADAARFIWQMETKQIDKISNWFKPVELEDIQIYIEIDEDGKASLSAQKDGKKLASIPSRFKKNALITEGTQVSKSLKEQHRRAKTTLQNAMVNRDAFMASELNLLMTNPIISAILCKILFVNENEIGFLKDGMLCDSDGKNQTANGEIYIAHPCDFVKANVWSKWQKYICNNQIRQPFKQVFREYYCPTVDEIKEKTISRRYSGHQIMPKKAAMLAKSRGWNAADGFFKVYYKENIMVELFSGNVWFSPADIEPPVIEEIRFINNRTGEPINISDLPLVLFSETMRDIDLFVSVAHHGAIDPEASLSTVDMRKSIIVALLPLLKLNNVILEGSHALIKGQFGEYSVHLGSGTSHMQAKGMIPIVPIHSGQRGRVFLPFVDDDPKTSEIISKVILLSEDSKIKDPNILQFIKA